MAGVVAAAPKPVLIVDHFFFQPWLSTDGTYPAFVIDPSILGNLKQRGVEEHDRIFTLIQ